MAIRLIRKSDVVAGAPTRWAEQYRGYGDKSGKTAALLALQPGFTAEQVNDIIGNDTWTECRCDECREDAPVLVQVGDEPDYEARWVDLCPDCISKALAALSIGDKQ